MTSPGHNEHVVLLHGLGETPLRMMMLEAACLCAGYSTTNLYYPSTTARVEILAEEHVGPVIQKLSGKPKLHFITHSLGGILLRYYAQAWGIANLGRAVFLTPANHGSEIMDFFAHFPPFIAWNGPAALQSGVGKHCFPCELPGAMPGEVGVIAGSLSLDPLSWFFVPFPNDGRSSVASTQLSAMQDHLVLPVSHDSVTFNGAAILQTLHFLKHGSFSHEPASLFWPSPHASNKAI